LFRKTRLMSRRMQSHGHIGVLAQVSLQHVKKAQRGSRELYSYLTLALHRRGWSTTCPYPFTQKKLVPIVLVQDAGHASETVYIGVEEKISHTHRGLNPKPSIPQQIATQTTLCWPLVKQSSCNCDKRTMKSGYTAINLKHFITYTVSKRTTSTHFVLCNTSWWYQKYSGLKL
jgi:hypothetical protein